MLFSNSFNNTWILKRRLHGFEIKLSKTKVAENINNERKLTEITEIRAKAIKITKIVVPKAKPNFQSVVVVKNSNVS